MSARMGRPPTGRTAIEQAVARGRSLDWMLENLAVTPRQIDDTLAAMDKVNAEDGDDDPDRISCPQAAIHVSPKKRGPRAKRPQAGSRNPQPRPDSDGMEALREAARVESARVYGQLCREHRSSDDAVLVDIEAACRRKRGAA